jgi:uncharacterized protein YraI
MAVATTVVFFREDDRSPRREVTADRALPAATSSLSNADATLTAAPSGTPRATTVAVTPTTARAVSVRAGSVTNVRAGPGVSFAVIGSLQAGDEAPATGRNADASWLLIDLTTGMGWVSSEVVDVLGDPTTLAVADAATTRMPTTAATGTPPRSPSPSPIGTATRTATPTAGRPTGTPSPVSAVGLPDLVLQEAVVGPAGRLTLIIANAGPGTLSSRRVSVIGIDDTGAVVFGEVTPALTIPAGGALNVELSYRPAAAITLTVVLNADGSIEEITPVNNRRRVTLRP